MEKPINVTESFLPPLEEYAKLLKNLWETKHLTNRGEYVIELESKIQTYLNSKSKPLLVSNGTIALQIAIKALGLKGDIITTPFSYVATTSSIIWEGCNPIFVDINTKYLTIDETKIEAAITKHTCAILATHVYGNPCNVEAIEKIAKKFDLKVIYDAAHCFGVKYKGKSIFDYGDISTCSFHATKTFHTGEGGAIFCNNESLTKRVFDSHNFGHKDNLSFNGIGINGKMSEINGALGLSIIEHMDTILKKREEICLRYNAEINNIEINKINLRKDCNWNYSYYPVIFKTEKDLLAAELKFNENQIFPRRYFYPSLNKLPYIDYNRMPKAEDISKRILCLPLHPNLKLEDQYRIIKILNR
jgi:dTDP-4-amino-4,6-dideoxygalactose transaminase